MIATPTSRSRQVYVHLPPSVIPDLSKIHTQDCSVVLYQTNTSSQPSRPRPVSTTQSLCDELALRGPEVNQKEQYATGDENNNSSFANHSPTQPDGPRRSKRLRQSQSYISAPTGTRLGTLPQYDRTECSWSSLNTTMSQAGPSADDVQSGLNLPKWSVRPDTLTSLYALFGTARGRATSGGSQTHERRRVNVLFCIMSVDAPKKVGKGAVDLWVSTWRVSAAPRSVESAEDPVSGEVTLWGVCAKEWGAMVRKGDVVLLKEADFRPAGTTKKVSSAQLVVAQSGPRSPPEPVILFRTLPRYGAMRDDYVYRSGPRGAMAAGERGAMNEEDRRLRPDLRAHKLDRGVLLVAEQAQWCATWVGGEGPSW